jgi:hypothetical protein
LFDFSTTSLMVSFEKTDDTSFATANSALLALIFSE